MTTTPRPTHASRHSRIGTVGVLVCTHEERRLPLVTAAVASLRTQSDPPDHVLVMVDGDDTLRDTVAAALPSEDVRGMGHNQGVSAARNAGAEAIGTDWVVFLDDDAEADPDWMERLLEPLGPEGVIGASSRSEPIWDAPRPSWLPDEYLWAWGCSYRGMPTTRTRVRNPYGGTSVVRREVFLGLGGYDSAVGHHGDVVGGGEEALFGLRAARAEAGWFVFEPAAAARHHVPASRLTWGYLARRCYSEGVMKARLSALSGGDALGDERSFALGLPLATLRCAVRPATAPRAVGLVVATVCVLAGLVSGSLGGRLARLTRRRTTRG